MSIIKKIFKSSRSQKTSHEIEQSQDVICNVQKSQPSYEEASSSHAILHYPIQVVSSPLEHEHQTELLSQHVGQPYDKKQQLPSIYSGIGLGVYQGEAVVFLQMAVGEKRWIVSKLQFEDLALLPSLIQSEVSLLLCLLRLNKTQSDLLKQGLQTKGGIELMKCYCPKVDNAHKSPLNEEDENNLSIVRKTEFPLLQKQCHQECLICYKTCVLQSNMATKDS